MVTPPLGIVLVKLYSLLYGGSKFFTLYLITTRRPFLIYKPGLSVPSTFMPRRL